MGRSYRRLLMGRTVIVGEENVKLRATMRTPPSRKAMEVEAAFSSPASLVSTI